MQPPDGVHPIDPNAEPLSKSEDKALGVLSTILLLSMLIAALFGIRLGSSIENKGMLSIVEIVTNYKIAVIILAMMLSYYLFIFKNRSQYWYGFCEVIVATFALANFIFAYDILNLSNSIAWIAGFFGPVYIAVRGFSNMRDGSEKSATQIKV